MRRAVILLAACHSNGVASHDAGSVDAPAPPAVTITATVDSTRFVTREHMLAAGEMQISRRAVRRGDGPRPRAATAATTLPPDLYFDTVD